VLLTVIKDGDTFKIDSLQQEVRALNFNEDEY
jgi:hypothetical protein